MIRCGRLGLGATHSKSAKSDERTSGLNELQTTSKAMKKLVYLQKKNNELKRSAPQIRNDRNARGGQDDSDDDERPGKTAETKQAKKKSDVLDFYLNRKQKKAKTMK